MIRNIRDLGGLTGVNGRKIKKNMLIRAARLSKLDEEDIKWFRSIGLDLILDLRTPTEVNLKPDVQVEGITNINFCLQEETNGLTLKGLRALINSAQNDEERLLLIPDMKDIYAAMVSDPYSKKRFAELIKTIVFHDSGAVLFHCTSGKDRTGMTAAVLCLILGVSIEDIYDDYLRSLEHAEWEAAIMREQFIDEGASEIVADKLKQFFTLDREYLDTFFLEIDKQYGSTEKYIREGIGLDDAAVENFRERLLKNE